MPYPLLRKLHRDLRALSRERVRVEQVMASLKRFRILRDTFSLARRQFDAAVQLIARIHNMERGFDA